jgi:hypothetical protein
LILFLGLLPQGEDKHNREPHSSEFLNGIIHYLFLPLTAGYLTVLYMYAARILVSWELPTGWVSWLIVALMTVCIAIQFGLYPTRLEENKRFDNWIARWMPVLILPLLLLILLGGVLYTAGAIVYAKKGFRYHHLVWHLFIDLALLSHLAGIVFFIG